jgi:membrane-bound lytic murein transglycosylase D
MTRLTSILALCLGIPSLHAQTNEALSTEDLLNMGQQFLEENVEEEVLAQFQQLDEKKVQALLHQLQTSFDSEYVLDLAALNDAAEVGLTLLSAHPDTEPYAEWLRPRLDYFTTAQELDQWITIPPTTTNNPVPRKPTPTFAMESKAWAKSTKARPRPAAATKYEAELKPIFTRHGVPAELFWIAEVESSFNPKARSPAGALGMYQLMPATAQSLGLSTWPFDERKNPEKSAAAAARHLHSLYRQFNDWPLAVAAYNAGASRVQAKLDSTKGKTFADISRKLPSETQMYVPKLDAILKLREGKSLEELGKL